MAIDASLLAVDGPQQVDLDLLEHSAMDTSSDKELNVSSELMIVAALLFHDHTKWQKLVSTGSTSPRKANVTRN
jgi:hypothetical protein